MNYYKLMKITSCLIFYFYCKWGNWQAGPYLEILMSLLLRLLWKPLETVVFVCDEKIWPVRFAFNSYHPRSRVGSTKTELLDLYVE